jgi:radical SAM family RiPP maturation amino acid epimerase
MTDKRSPEYWEYINKKSSSELDILSQIKRVVDLFDGDGRFRQLVELDKKGAAAYASDFGVIYEPTLLISAMLSSDCLDNSVLDTKRLALKSAWTDFIQKKLDLNKDLLEIATSSTSSRFDIWRERQRNRVNSELGDGGETIPHSLFAIELSQGCSVGCSFCGVSAAKFKGHATYDNDCSREWRVLLKGLNSRFGHAASSGFLYWGSDPLDNPDYLKFSQDFYTIMGCLPQVTTAIPLRRKELTRDALRNAINRSLVPYRFSVLSQNIFRRILNEFTPMDLLHVELVFQSAENHVPRAQAGRGRNAMAAEKPDSIAPISPSTIACVTGFLINFPEKRVQIISPTRASDAWPNGYIVFSETISENADGMLSSIDSMLEQLAIELDYDKIIRFRSDFDYQRVGDGFYLENASLSHNFDNFGGLADLISTSQFSINNLIETSNNRKSNSEAETEFIEGIFHGSLIHQENEQFDHVTIAQGDRP